MATTPPGMTSAVTPGMTSAVTPTVTPAMTLSPAARFEIDQLLDVVRKRPWELPIGEIAGLTRHGLTVDVDRTGPAPVVYVAHDGAARFGSLSPREHEVVALLAGGFSNEQIAATLFVSLATVKGHIHSIFSKTGLRSRTQVVAAWYGGLELPD